MERRKQKKWYSIYLLKNKYMIDDNIGLAMKQLYDTIKWRHEWDGTSEEDIKKEFYIAMINILDKQSND